MDSSPFRMVVSTVKTADASEADDGVAALCVDDFKAKGC